MKRSIITAATVLALAAGATSVVAQDTTAPSTAPQAVEGSDMPMKGQRMGRGMGMGMGHGMSQGKGHGMKYMGKHRGMGHGMMPRAMMTMMFVMADTNGNGTVSFDEITAIEKRFFDLIDTNDDAEMSQDELRAFMQSMMGKGKNKKVN